MYCRNCGTQLEDNTRYCPKCGTDHQGTPTASESANTTMIVALVMNVIILLSAFVKTFYLQTWERSTFSSFGAYKTVHDFLSDIGDYAMTLGFYIDLNAGSSDSVETLKTLGSYTAIVIIFDIVMYLFGFVEVILALINLKKSEGKFWKALISSSLAMFVANMIVYGFIALINLTVKSIESHYIGISQDVMGATGLFWAFEAIAVIIYIMAHINHVAWKKADKERINREAYYRNKPVDELDLSSIGSVTSKPFSDEAPQKWRCKRCGKMNKPNSEFCECGSPRGFED